MHDLRAETGSPQAQIEVSFWWTSRAVGIRSWFQLHDGAAEIGCTDGVAAGTSIDAVLHQIFSSPMQIPMLCKIDLSTRRK